MSTFSMASDRSVAATLFACALAATASADTDGRVKLRPGEGLLFLPVESSSTVKLVRFVRDEPSPDQMEISGVEIGRFGHLYRLPAGEWRLKYMRLNGKWEVNWGSREEQLPRFAVEEGKLNYCGDLHLSSQGNRMRAISGNYGFDQLPTLLLKHPEIRPDLLAAYPLAVCDHLRGRPTLAAPEPQSWPDWMRAFGSGPDGDELARVNRGLAKVGVAPIALGESQADLLARYKNAPRRLMRVAAYDEDPTWLWLEFRGWWGTHGAALSARLAFVDGKLTRVSLYAVRNYQWLAPGPDMLEDFDGWIAQKG